MFHSKSSFFSLLIQHSRWNENQQAGSRNEQEDLVSNLNGFGSLSRRQCNKPIIAAVNGGAYGGGLEIILNCDIVIASVDAKFALPEVKRGVVAAQGGECARFRMEKLLLPCFNIGIPRLSQIAGHQVCSEFRFEELCMRSFR